MSDTMIINGSPCTVVYVDGSAGAGGTGLLPSTAFNTFPAFAGIVSNTVYIFRRVTNVLTVPSGNFGASVDHVYFMGAPMSTDPLFLAAPANIKAGGDVDWCGEAGTYATMKVNANADNHQFYGGHFGTSRIDWRFRNDQNGSGYVWLVNQNTGTSVNRTFFCSYMKIWVDTVQLDQGGYNTNYSFNTTAWANVDCASTTDQSVVIKHCTFLIPYELPAGFFITALFAKSVVVKDITIYHAGYNGNTSTPVFNLGISNATAGYGTSRMRFEDVTMYAVAQNMATQGFFRLALLYASSSMTVKNVSYTLQRFYTGAKSTITTLRNYGGIYMYHGAIIQAESITIDLTGPDGDGFNSLTVGYGLINFAGMYSFITANNFTGSESYIKNLTAKLADTSFAAGQAPDGWAISLINTPKIKIDNIVAWGYRSSVTYPALNVNPSYPGTTITNASVKGPINVNTVTLSIPGTWSCANIVANLLTAANSTVYINTVALPAGWAAQVWANVNNSARVFVDNVNVGMYYTLAGANEEGVGMLACNNVQGITGNWQSTNYMFKGVAWNVHRTGGGNASIKLAKENAASQDVQNYGPLVIGSELLRSMEYTPGTTGAYTATVHIAFKNVTDADTGSGATFVPGGYAKRFKVILEVPDVEGTAMGRKEYVYSQIDGSWQSDSGSTWVNDTGLTQMKMVIPFNAVRTDAPVTVRMVWGWWDSRSDFVFYLDPIVEFAAL